MQRTLRKFLRAVADYDPDYYDMYADPNEAFFAQLYVERIRQHAAAGGFHPPATVLEAGCQAGRLVVPLAKLGFQVTGVDTSGFALRRAEQHVRAAGVSAQFIHGDVIEVLQAHPEWRYDVVVCAEVVYLSARYRELLQVLAGAVQAGGLVCVSHRPLFYYLMEAVRQGDFSSAQEVLARREGPFRESAYYNWQTEDELRALYRSLDLEWLAAYPIDRLAWLSGVSPATLTPVQREQWLALELGLSTAQAECARYVLVVAEKPQQDHNERKRVGG